MTQFNSLVGCAGAGKTRRIVEIVEAHEDRQTATILSFSNAAVEELRHRLPSDVGSVTTIHKLAYDLVMDGSKILVNLPPQFNTREMQHIQLCRTRGLAIPARLQSLHDAFTKWKVKTGRIDTIDVLQDTLELAATYCGSLLVVDEAQDLNAAQLKFVMAMAKNFHTVWMCGDPDQQVYGFQGSSSEVFNSYISIANQHTLDISHRCTQHILDAGTGYLAKSNVRRVLKSAVGQGVPVRVVHSPSPLQSAVLGAKSATTDTMVLCRTNTDVDTVTRLLWSLGVGCISTSPQNPLGKGSHAQLPATYTDPTLVNVMTVHAAKGLEATNVILLDTPVQGDRATPPARVWYNKLMYVGCTRAKQSLTIIRKATPLDT